MWHPADSSSKFNPSVWCVGVGQMNTKLQKYFENVPSLGFIDKKTKWFAKTQSRVIGVFFPQFVLSNTNQDASHSSVKELLLFATQRVASGQAQLVNYISIQITFSMSACCLGPEVPRSVTGTTTTTKKKQWLGNNKILPIHRGLLITRHILPAAFSRPVWLKVNMYRKCIQWL